MILDHEPRPLTDVNRGIISGRRVSPRQLRAMAEGADAEAVKLEDAAARHRHRADVYRDVAAARERGEL